MSLDDELTQLEASDPTVARAGRRLELTSTSIRSAAALLRQTQQALAASQADLTRVTEERDEAREALTTAETTLLSVRAELARVRDELTAKWERALAEGDELTVRVMTLRRERDETHAALVATENELAKAVELAALARAELASARQELARLRALCATEPGTDPLSATTDSPPIPAGDRKETE